MAKRVTKVSPLAAVKALSARLDGDETAKASDFEELLIKGEDRVKKHGEVFTPSNIVKDMLDLVPQFVMTETEYSDVDRINCTVLEPSCGNGNIMIEVLNRKLISVYNLPQDDLFINILRAVASLYGVDIQKDNVLEARERLFKYIVDFNKKQGLDELPQSLLSAISKVLELNIIWGNTLKYVSFVDEDVEEAMMIYDWYFENINGNIQVRREGSYLSDLDTVVYKDNFSLIELR